MRLYIAVAMLVLAAGPGSAQRSEREDQQRHRQALDHYRKGQDAMSSEHLEQAVQEFKAAIQLDPLLTLAHYRLGQAHMSLKDYALAERDFLGCRDAYEKVASLQFTNREELERRREEEIDQLQNYLGLLQSGQIKNSNPSVPIQVQQQIDALQRNRRKGSSDTTSIPAEVSVSLGSAYFRQGKLPEAEKEWKAAEEANPKMGEAHNNLAALYLMTSRLDDAEKELKLAEKSGYPVHPRLKDDIKKARKSVPSN
ncbi:MAG TPA: tetratricopeptide repeat protein [Vicinamibacteria bacterium]